MIHPTARPATAGGGSEPGVDVELLDENGPKVLVVVEHPASARVQAAPGFIVAGISVASGTGKTIIVLAGAWVEYALGSLV